MGELRRIASGALAWCAALAVGCGEPAMVPADGGDGSVAVADAAVIGAQIAWIERGDPAVAPPTALCPAGWRVVGLEGEPDVCEPWPEGGARDDCAAHEAHFPGAPGCARIGSECGDGWPAPRAALHTIHVDDDAAAGGDGTSRGAALRTLGEALAIAVPGDAVLIAEGSYAEAVVIPDEVALVGACAERTLIVAPPHASDAVVSASGRATIEGVTLSGDREGLLASSGATVRATGVVIRDVLGAGVRAVGGARVTLDHVAIRDVGERAADGQQGRGISASGASVEGSFVVIERAHEIGVYGGRFATVTLSDVAVRDIEPRRADQILGRGVSVEPGAVLALVRAAVERTSETAIFGTGGASMDLTDVLVREVRMRRDRTLGLGLEAQAGALLDADRVRIEGTPSHGLYAQGGATGAMRDLVVRDTGADAVVLGSMSTMLALERVDIRRAVHTGLAVGELATLIASDVRVHDVALREGLNGIGVLVADRGVATLERVIVERCGEASMTVTGAESSLRVVDGAVRENTGNTMGRTGNGLVSSYDGLLSLERVLVERTLETGVLAHQGTIEARDVWVRDITTSESNGGAGIWAQSSATVTLSGATIERAQQIGLAAISRTSITAERVRIASTARAGCADTTCPMEAGGFGASAQFDGARLTLTQFEIDGAEVCGVIVGETGELDISRGLVTRAAIGACVQTPDYALSRLMSEVVYRDNGRPLEASSYPLPGARPDFE